MKYRGLLLVVRTAARPPTPSAFRLTSAHQPVGQGWPYWALSGTAVAVGQSLEGSIDGSTARTRLEGVPGRWTKSARDRCVSRALLHPASQSGAPPPRRGPG